MNDKELQKIVHRRFTMQELEERLGMPVQESQHEYAENEDYCLICGNNEGYGTIWYAKTRKGDMYITETVWEKG